MQKINFETHCSLPWTRFDSMFNSFCCKNVLPERFESFDQIQKSQTVQELKNDLLNGIKNQACYQCWEEDAAGKVSMRKASIDSKSAQELLNEIDNNKIRQLILFTGNNCNLACRTCSGYLSSSHVVEARSKNLKYPDVVIHDIVKPDYEYFLNQDYSNLESLQIIGGEPLLNVGHIQVLEKIVNDGYAQNCSLTYTTNATHKISKKHLQLLSYFKEINFIFSIDAVGEQFNYIRTGADWNWVSQNIQNIRAELKQFDKVALTIHPTISVLNILYLEDLYDWLAKEKFNVWFDFCFHPRHYSFELLNSSQKNEIDSVLSQSKHDMSSIRNFIKNTNHTPELYNDFLNETAWTEEYHKMSLKQYLPKLANLLT